MLDQFIQFVYHHWGLWLALAAIILLLIIEETRGRAGGVRKINPQESVNLINKEDALVVDIRDKKAFSAGHIANAKNFPKENTDDYPSKLQQYRSRPILVVCYAGVSSLKAAQELKKQGFDNIYSLAGGMNEWKNTGLPVVKD